MTFKPYVPTAYVGSAVQIKEKAKLGTPDAPKPLTIPTTPFIQHKPMSPAQALMSARRNLNRAMKGGAV